MGEDALISCESRMVEIQQCGVIAKVVVQRAAGNTVNVTLHSSHEYARGVSDVVGRSSIAAQVGAGDPEKEDDILAELMDAAVNVPEVQSNAPLLAGKTDMGTVSATLEQCISCGGWSS